MALLCLGFFQERPREERERQRLDLMDAAGPHN